VLKGQELINSAKVKNLANDFRNISTFVYAYQDKFRALPGDDRAATAHVGAPAVCAGTAACPEPPAANVGNGRINGPWLGAGVTEESYLFWQHIRVANLAAGPTATGGADYIPRNADGGLMGITGEPVITTAGAWSGNFFVCSAGIQGRFARQIDSMIDDGNTLTGSFRVIGTVAENVAAPGGLATAAASVTLLPADDSTLFTVCVAN
jgi:hypothetical protein